jgi:hypothetical protein
MESEAKIILAFLFKRSGKTELKESELYLPLSMELGWLSTKESQEFVTYAIAQGLLVKKEGKVRPTFSFESISIPVGFTPSKRLSREDTHPQKTGNVLDAIVQEIHKKTNQDETEILDEIRKEAQEKHLLVEVAALSVAKRCDLDVTAWLDPVEAILFTENTG